MTDKKKKKIIITVLLIAIALVSAFGVSKIASSPKSHKKTIEALDDKEKTVLKLTASSAAASTALAAVPGDATTPVANKLADFTSYFLAILTMVFLEKYLVTLTGYAVFTFLIPFACAIGILALWWNKSFLKILAVKIAVFGLVIFAIIPVSMKVSAIIEKTHELSVEATMEEANKLTDEVNENVDEDGTVIEKFLNQVKGGASGLAVQGEALLNNFIETIAVMLVTSCVIPIVVLVFAVGLVKMIFGVQINVGKSRNKNKRLT